MKYNELKVSAAKSSKRVGRGIASGKGKTAGRGTKGQGSRTGFTKRPGFEGGQNPIMQVLPKLRGFTNLHIKSEEVYTGQLEVLSGQVIDATLLCQSGLISSPFVKVKLLVGKGELTKKVNVKLPAASGNAITIVQEAGGSFEVTARLGHPVTRTAKKNK
jgi:large subunit ribosomal protein L15